MDIDRRLESSLEITEESTGINTPQDEHPLALLLLNSGGGSTGGLSRSSSASESAKSYQYEGDSDVIYLKSELLKGVGGCREERPRQGKSAAPKASGPLDEYPSAATLSEDHRFSNSQMVSPKQTDHALWTLWLSALKNSSN
ncbi:UNVERIFIED_CONTAM: hypothetical protein PYX00_010017 [Menopon gallinae]|uniref:Uncharacterized protein n=1 Tax=Menopon gallinae TaxID=328185 RepID=A0AAW2HE62_9NEOP